ncbi:hypothetical protein BDW66DRAFT_123354 [Aspergillus desertorum]
MLVRTARLVNYVPPAPVLPPVVLLCGHPQPISYAKLHCATPSATGWPTWSNSEGLIHRSYNALIPRLTQAWSRL